MTFLVLPSTRAHALERKMTSSAPDREPVLFNVVSAEVGGVPVLELEGELDLATVDTFSEAAGPHMHAPALLVDLTGLAFMDSSGLRALLDLRRTLGDQLLIVCPPGGAVRRLFEVSGLQDAFRLVASRETAISDASSA